MNYLDKPSSNTNAVITISAVANKILTIDSIQWSYDGNPTNGVLSVDSVINSVTTRIFEVSVTVGGPGFINFNGLNGDRGGSLVVTLSAGGSGISGKINVQTR